MTIDRYTAEQVKKKSITVVINNTEFRIRPLTTREFLRMQRFANDPEKIAEYLIRTCVVEPRIDDIDNLTPGELMLLIDKISEISGLKEIVEVASMPKNRS